MNRLSVVVLTGIKIEKREVKDSILTVVIQRLKRICLFSLLYWFHLDESHT